MFQLNVLCLIKIFCNVQKNHIKNKLYMRSLFFIHVTQVPLLLIFKIQIFAQGGIKIIEAKNYLTINSNRMKFFLSSLVYCSASSFFIYNFFFILEIIFCFIVHIKVNAKGNILS